MNRVITTILAGAALLGTASVANATIITTPTQTVTFATTPTDWTQSGSFTLFNTALGTLQGIIISETYADTGTVSVSNAVNASASATGYAETSSRVTLSSTNTAINAVIDSLFTQSGQTANSGRAVAIGTEYDFSNLAPGSSTGAQESDGSISLGGTEVTTAADLTPFETTGVGTASVQQATFTSATISYNGGNASATQSTSSGGTFSIAYVYDNGVTTVPEPASMALLGAGLVGAGLVRRRK